MERARAAKMVGAGPMAAIARARLLARKEGARLMVATARAATARETGKRAAAEWGAGVPAGGWVAAGP